MKDTRYFMFILLIVFMSACSSDDECTPESVAGTYNFQSAECDPASNEEMSELNSLENTELFIIKAIDANTISIEGDDGEAIEFVLNGCSFDTEPISVEFFGITISAEYSGEFNGDELILNLSTEFSGQIEGEDPIESMKTSCTIIGSK